LYSFVVLLHDVCVLPRHYVIHFLLLWHDIAYLSFHYLVFIQICHSQ